MGAVAVVAGAVGRNRPLLRLISAYGLFVVAEYASWLAVLVFAFRRGGATESGLVAVAQLLPAAAAAPSIAAFADRSSPARLLLVGFLAQATAMAVAAAAMMFGSAYIVYPAAVVATISMVTTRPAQVASLPELAREAHDITAANIGLGWTENAGVVVAGLLSGALLTWRGAASVLIATAVLLLFSAVLVLPLPGKPPIAGNDDRGSSLRDAVRLLVGPAGPRSLAVVFSAEWLLMGALDVLYVVIAIDILTVDPGWVGYLQTAFGVGGIAAGLLTAHLVGRRLSTPILSSALLCSCALALVVVRGGTVITALLLAVVGATHAVQDVAGRTLLQRAVPVHVLGRVFGLLEGISLAGLAAGSLLVPLLIGVGGDTVAVLGIAAILLLAVAFSARSLVSLDASKPPATGRIEVLQQVSLFAGLPAPVLEGLAGALQPREIPAGGVLMREGETGLHYFILNAGELAVTQGGRELRRLQPMEGAGEIALLRDVPRTATVTATVPSVVYQLDREPFLAAVTGHAPTREAADAIVDQHLSRGDP